MAVHKFNDPRIYLAQYEVTTDHSMVRVTTTAESLDATAFSATTRNYIGGLKSHALDGEGFLQYNTTAIEAILSAQIAASAGTVYTVTPEGGAVGEEAFFGRTLVTGLQPVGGTVGDIHKFTFSGVGFGAYPCIKGQLFKASGATTATSSSSAVQLGAVTAGQRVYASLHVLSVSGTNPTLDVVVESDDNGGMSSATTRATFTQATAATSEFVSAAGAITDDYWRITYTIGGTDTPTFSFVVAIGIL